ncbi:seryl-tRNA synthetase [Histoplasma capsulatum G186AR]|uniref:serine--tRNA ligase n=2 Tax=Ajellomyces capsulatus TaxID=5037 RepID=C0NE91_AJECG|nr:seryl-tRNA synthetase [Histoplasma capsulatum G186AR]EEH10539.1 seryl-tRNA synthetase [Histoplasma capsulatum G186AR]KAG5290473.1 seryl-tRNA synthetase [Histoplasma capsulatum]QSS72401.1 seryl-tRNA synthetase [Histoplasma capsulatum G186AR]
MLDVADFVHGATPEKITENRERLKENQRRRGAPVEAIDEVIALFKAAREARYDVTQIGEKINKVQKEIGKKKKNKEDAADLIAEKTELEKQKKDADAAATEKELLRDRKLASIGNYVHEDVPTSQDEADNAILSTWAPEWFKEEKPAYCLSHDDVLHRLDGFDQKRGTKIFGHRGYCLINYGLLLNLALVNYGLEFLFRKKYTLNQPPYFMLKQFMAKTAQLEQFDEELYKVTENEDKASERYLIATSEQPLSALHSGEWLQDSDLPIKYAGYSTCYRKEAGSHGKEVMGIFRVHQFEKIEQFVMTKPEDSWDAFKDMMKNSEEFYQSLGLPYRVVDIVSGALNNAASRKNDLEAWFPSQGKYKELVSCSNCTDYQTRALEIRYRQKKDLADEKESGTDENKKIYVHALNATLCATERTLCCILENYQTETGIIVPEVLRKYIPGQPKEIPYTKELVEKPSADKSKTKAKQNPAPKKGNVTEGMRNLKV